jgi:hypothetical protein
MIIYLRKISLIRIAAIHFAKSKTQPGSFAYWKNHYIQLATIQFC